MSKDTNGGYTKDHTGKRSSSRLVSIMTAVTLNLCALGHVFKADSGEIQYELLITLGAVILGPLGFNRWLGEKEK